MQGDEVLQGHVVRIHEVSSSSRDNSRYIREKKLVKCIIFRMAGQTVSGHYIIKSEVISKYSVVHCDFTKSIWDPDLEENLGQLPVGEGKSTRPTAVMFRAVRTNADERFGYISENGTVTYDNVTLNVGGGMRLSGEFVAPVSGLYAFFLFANTYRKTESSRNIAYKVVKLSGGGGVEEILYSGDEDLFAPHESFYKVTVPVLGELERGDSVRVKFEKHSWRSATFELPFTFMGMRVGRG
jgi:hypothetical protein